jgi:hypothetical protein
MGVCRLFSRVGQKFSRGGQEPTFCLKTIKRYYFSIKTYHFWPARGGGARVPPSVPSDDHALLHKLGEINKMICF